MLKRWSARRNSSAAHYSFGFTLTTVILENPSSKVGAFSLALIRAHYVFGHYPLSPLIPLQANFQRDIEENSLHFVAIVMSQV